MEAKTENKIFHTLQRISKITENISNGIKLVTYEIELLKDELDTIPIDIEGNGKTKDN